MWSHNWELLFTDIMFIGCITASIVILAMVLARQESRESQSTEGRIDQEPLRRAS